MTASLLATVFFGQTAALEYDLTHVSAKSNSRA